MNTTELVVEMRAEKKFRPIPDLNQWPLPTELTSQLEAGHNVGSK